MEWLNLAASAAKSPSTYGHKLLNRVRPKTSQAGRQWAESRAVGVEVFTTTLDSALAEEARIFSEDHVATCRRKLQQLRETTGLSMGGGADSRLLYFLTRLLRPESVIETGVAMGFSSRAILSAMKRNESGRLMSSDLPYARISGSHDLVGYVVEPDLSAERWTLDIRGDRKALAAFSEVIPPRSLEVLHYDSDKSDAGHELALKLLAPVLSDETTLVFDDINDSLWFSRFVARSGGPYVVLRFSENWPKYVGLTGKLASIYHMRREAP